MQGLPLLLHRYIVADETLNIVITFLCPPLFQFYPVLAFCSSSCIIPCAPALNYSVIYILKNVTTYAPSHVLLQLLLA